MGRLGVRLFRDDSLELLRNGYISSADFRELDRVRDKLLLDYLIVQAPDRYRERSMRRYGLTEVPELLTDPDWPEGDDYHVFQMLKEQVQRESDREALKKAAFDNCEPVIRRFAFYRLSGCSFVYPTDYRCGLKSDMLREDIEEFCKEMAKRDDPYIREAQAWLDYLPKVTDEELDALASGDLERFDYRTAGEAMKEQVSPADGSGVFREGELEAKIRGLADAYILLVYEERCGKLTRRERLLATDPFIRIVLEAYRRFTREMIPDITEAVKGGLYSSGLAVDGKLPNGLTGERIRELVWPESDADPKHGYFLDLARKADIR